MDIKYYRVHADIDLNAIRYNIVNIKKRLTSDTKICAVIKADAYGHGAVPIARYLSDIVDFFAVATMDEAIELRTNDIRIPILILGYVHPDNVFKAVENNIRFTVYTLEMAKELSQRLAAINQKLKIHIKIDTGMNRIGFKPSKKNLNCKQPLSAASRAAFPGQSGPC